MITLLESSKKVSCINFLHVLGHDYIMTFKDSSVLMADDEEELLENIELQSSFKQKMSERRKATGYEDDTNKKVLPQYEEEDEAEIARKK